MSQDLNTTLYGVCLYTYRFSKGINLIKPVIVLFTAIIGISSISCSNTHRNRSKQAVTDSSAFSIIPVAIHLDYDRDCMSVSAIVCNPLPDAIAISLSDVQSLLQTALYKDKSDYLYRMSWNQDSGALIAPAKEFAVIARDGLSVQEFSLCGLLITPNEGNKLPSILYCTYDGEIHYRVYPDMISRSSTVRGQESVRVDMRIFR
jgi:hypothetical protein